MKTVEGVVSAYNPCRAEHTEKQSSTRRNSHLKYARDTAARRAVSAETATELAVTTGEDSGCAWCAQGPEKQQQQKTPNTTSEGSKSTKNGKIVSAGVEKIVKSAWSTPCGIVYR